jgi:hypothetical protein
MIHLAGFWGARRRAACGTFRPRRLTSIREAVTCERCRAAFGRELFERRVARAQ